MDKPLALISSATSQKRGFALIITLSVLTVLIALTGVLIGYLDIARKEASATKALIQANLYFADLKGIIGKFKEKKTLYNTLYTSPVPLQSADGRFSITLQCRPLTNGVNINWLGYDNDPLMAAQYNAAQKVFEALVQEHNIKDPSRLEEILFEAIGGDKGGVREEQRRLRQKDGIISYQQFRQLLSRYQFEVDDNKIGRIAWRKYFVFNPVSKVAAKNVIAGDYLSIELLSILFDIDKETLKAEWIEAEGALKGLLFRYGIAFDKKLYTEKFVDQSHCEVTFGYEGEEFMFAFIDKEGEVKDFEFYTKQ